MSASTRPFGTHLIFFADYILSAKKTVKKCKFLAVRSVSYILDSFLLLFAPLFSPPTNYFWRFIELLEHLHNQFDSIRNRFPGVLKALYPKLSTSFHRLSLPTAPRGYFEEGSPPGNFNKFQGRRSACNMFPGKSATRFRTWNVFLGGARKGFWGMSIESTRRSGIPAPNLQEYLQRISTDYHQPGARVCEVTNIRFLV